MNQYKYTLNVMQMSEDDGIDICSWQYPSPYHIYNWPSWESLVLHQREFADPDIRLQQYFSVKTDQAQLISFFQLFPLHNTIRLGIFVHPSFLNQGIGKQVCILAIATASQYFSQPYLDLEVATWNKRAIHVYEQCGFTIEDEYELFNAINNCYETVYNMVYNKKSK